MDSQAINPEQEAVVGSTSPISSMGGNKNNPGSH